MRIITFFIFVMCILIAVGGYGVYALFSQPVYHTGEAEEYSVYPENFRFEANGEVATIDNDKLITSTGNFVLPIRGKYEYTGIVIINTVESVMGVKTHEVAVATGGYTDPEIQWSYAKGRFQWISKKSAPLFGDYMGLHIVSGDPEMSSALESLKPGDTVTITGYRGANTMTLIENGQTFTRSTDGCIRVIITGLKITRA